MVAEAIAALKERTGSSLVAIKKYIGDKYKKDLPKNWDKILAVQVRRLAASGKLVKVKVSWVASPHPRMRCCLMRLCNCLLWRC